MWFRSRVSVFGFTRQEPIRMELIRLRVPERVTNDVWTKQMRQLLNKQEEHWVGTY